MHHASTEVSALTHLLHGESLLSKREDLTILKTQSIAIEKTRPDDPIVFVKIDPLGFLNNLALAQSLFSLWRIFTPCVPYRLPVKPVLMSPIPSKSKEQDETEKE